MRAPSAGCYIEGLFLDGARWDSEWRASTEDASRDGKGGEGGNGGKGGNSGNGGNGALVEAQPRVLYPPLPAVWLRTTVEAVEGSAGKDGAGEDGAGKDGAGKDGGEGLHRYRCPVYMTADRAGQLTSTGQSSNFIMDVHLTMRPGDSSGHWMKRGLAALCSLP